MGTAHGKISPEAAKLIMRTLAWRAHTPTIDALATAGARADQRRDELLASARRRSAERTT